MSALKSLMLATIVEQTNAANTVQTQIAAATTDRTKAVHDALSDPDTDVPYVKEYQSWEEKALAKIEENRAKVAAQYEAEYLKTLTDEEVTALKEEHKSKVAAVKAAVAYAKLALGDQVSDEEFAALPSLKTARGKTAGQGGTGGKRPRVNAIAFRTASDSTWTEASEQRTNKDGEDVTVTNFTVLSHALRAAFDTKVEVKDLQAAAFEAAGTDDLNTLNGKVIEFAYTVGETNVFIKVQPKSPDAE